MAIDNQERYELAVGAHAKAKMDGPTSIAHLKESIRNRCVLAERVGFLADGTDSTILNVLGSHGPATNLQAFSLLSLLAVWRAYPWRRLVS